MKMEVDLLVLLVGMCSAESNPLLAESGKLGLRPSGFFDAVDSFAGNLRSSNPAVFFAGTATAPKNVGESINDGIAAAHRVYQTIKR